ncbi:MAG: condensation domain-containing protein [Nostoc sp.]
MCFQHRTRAVRIGSPENLTYMDIKLSSVIVSDGWSMGVFVQELAALYNAYSQGEPSLRDATRSLLPQRGTSLAPLPIQYADFTLWQRQWLQGNVLQSQLSYWQQQLKDAPTLLSLPTDRPRPAVQTFAGAYQEFTLSLELTDRLVKLRVVTIDNLHPTPCGGTHLKSLNELKSVIVTKVKRQKGNLKISYKFE